MLVATQLDEQLDMIIRDEGLEDAVTCRNHSKDSGYVAEVEMVTVKSKQKELSLFLKNLPRDTNSARYQAALVLFNIENNLYHTVMPEFRQLEADKGVGRLLDCIPKCYSKTINGNQTEVIVLENLIERGFCLWRDLKEPVDDDHIKCVMAAYGDFHATSLAYKDLHSVEKFNEIAVKMSSIKWIMEKYKDIDFLASMLNRAVGGFGKDEGVYVETFKDFIENQILDLMTQFYEEDKFDVIVHGDCWTNNFMFKYESSKPTQVALIDFQVAVRASPITDLAYFFCTSACSKETFDKIEDYLKYYYDRLSDRLRDFGCNPNSIISFSDLMEQWRKYGRQGLFWGTIINNMLIADKDEIADHAGSDILTSFDFESRHNDLYKTRMRDAISYFYDNNIL